MTYREFAEKAMEELMEEEPSFKNCEMLSWMLAVKHAGSTDKAPAQAAQVPGKMDKRTAEEWTHHMQNADGTTGAHWTMEQAEQAMKQYDVNCDPVEFFAALNMMYSDYCEVFKKYGVNKLDFYADMAKAFLDDRDAAGGKLSAYYEYVVRH